MRKVGEGGFSSVRIVGYTGADGEEKGFALKRCDKAKLVRLRQLTHIRYERDIVAALEHPFILKMYATFL